MAEKVTRKDVERRTIEMEYERQKRYDECNGKYLCRVVFTIIRADSRGNGDIRPSTFQGTGAREKYWGDSIVSPQYFLALHRLTQVCFN